MSTHMGCKIGAENTSLIGSKRNDLYEITTNIMNKLGGTNNKYEKDTVKYALMP